MKQIRAYLLFFLTVFILSGCEPFFKIEQAEWSGDGKTISVVSQGKVYFLDGESPYKLRPYQIENLAEGQISWAPLDNKLVYASVNEQKVWDLTVYELDRDRYTSLTNDIAKDFFPEYLNSEEILFYSDRDGRVVPWRYLNSSRQILLFEDPLPEKPEEGVSADAQNEIQISDLNEGSLVTGLYQTKKFKWEESHFKLKSPRWVPDNKRCLFIAENKKLFNGQFLYLLDFEKQLGVWIPVLPIHYLAFADYYAREKDWERSLYFDSLFLEIYPDHPQGFIALFRQAYFYFIVQPQFDQARVYLTRLIEKYPKSENIGSAHLWLGIIEGIQNENKKALKEFELAQKAELKEEWKEPITQFIEIIKLVPEKDLSPYFLGFKLQMDNSWNLAVENYQKAYNSFEDSPTKWKIGFLLAHAYEKANQEASAIKLLDQIVEKEPNTSWEARARFKIAAILERDSDTFEAAVQIYRKINPEYQKEGLEKLFYLYRDIIHNFKETEGAGQTFIKSFPDSPLWNQLYADLTELQEWFYEGIKEKALIHYYNGLLNQKRDNDAEAIKEFRAALKESDNVKMKQMVYQQLFQIHKKNKAEAVQALAALYAYWDTFEALTIDKEFLKQNFEDYLSLLPESLKPENASAVIKLSKEFLKTAKENELRQIAQFTMALAYFVERSWPNVTDIIAQYFSEPTHSELAQFYSYLTILQGLAYIEQNDWDKALASFNQPLKGEYAALARKYSEWIQLYRLEDNDFLKQIIKADLSGNSEFDLLMKTNEVKDTEALLVKLSQTKSPIQPLAILQLIEWIIQDSKQSVSEKRLRLYQLFNQLRNIEVGSEWEAKAWLKLARYEQSQSFFIVAEQSYENFIQAFESETLKNQARWYLAELYAAPFNQPDKREEKLKEIVESGDNSEWVRKTLRVQGKLNELVDQFPMSSEAGQALLEMGDKAFEDAEIEKSLEYYEQLKKYDLSENDEKLIRERLLLIHAGEDAVKLWNKIQKAEAKEKTSKGNRLYKKLISLSEDPAFQKLVLNNWIELLEQGEEPKELPDAFMLRLKTAASNEEWSKMLRLAGKYWGEADWKEFIQTVFDQVKYPKDLAQNVYYLKARQLTDSKEYKKAKLLLLPVLKQQNLLPELLNQYFLIQKALGSS